MGRLLREFFSPGLLVVIISDRKVKAVDNGH
jgi:hypothetical protein